MPRPLLPPSFFFFNDTATTEIYTLSLHDALPISIHSPLSAMPRTRSCTISGCSVINSSRTTSTHDELITDRKSTRLNSSHLVISYAVFCLKKKKNHDLISHTSVAPDVYCACNTAT